MWQNSRGQLGREAKERCNAETIVDANDDERQAFVDKLRNVLGNDDFDIDFIDDMEMHICIILVLHR